MRGFGRGQGLAGQQRPFWRQQAGEHRLMRERMPEPETIPVRRDQLQAHRLPQCRRHGGVRHAGHRAEDPPVEPAAEHRGRVDHPAGTGGQPVKPPPYRVGERARHPGPGQAGHMPVAVPLGQRPVTDQAGQDLLDQERQTLRPFCDQ